MSKYIRSDGRLYCMSGSQWDRYGVDTRRECNHLATVKCTYLFKAPAMPTAVPLDTYRCERCARACSSATLEKFPLGFRPVRGKGLSEIVPVDHLSSDKGGEND